MTPEERKADVAGPGFQRQMDTAPPLPGDDISGVDNLGHVHVQRRAFVNYSEPPDIFSDEINARRTAILRPHVTPMPGGDVPGRLDANPDVYIPPPNTSPLPESPFQFTPLQRFDQPSRVEGSIDSTITLIGAPPGTTAVLTSTTTGAVNRPALANHTGPMFPKYGSN